MNSKDFFSKFFGVMGSGRAYLALIYNVLAFPLGLFYFIFLITGLSVSIPLIIVFVGLLLVPLVMVFWWFLAWFERILAIALLGEEIGPMTLPAHPEDDFWSKIKNFLINPVTWKGLVYLLFKLPLGIISLIALALFGGLFVAFLVLPILALGFGLDFNVNLGWDLVYSLRNPGIAFLFFLLGILMWPISLHVFNGLGIVNGWFAKVMLGQYPYEPGAKGKAIVEAEPAPIVAVEAPLPPVVADEAEPLGVVVEEAEVEEMVVPVELEEPEAEAVVVPVETEEPEDEIAAEPEETEPPAPEPEPELPAPEPKPEQPVAVEKEASGQKIKIAGEMVGEEFGVRTFTRRVSNIRVLKSGVQRGEISYKDTRLQVERAAEEDNWEAKKVLG